MLIMDNAITQSVDSGILLNLIMHVYLDIPWAIQSALIQKIHILQMWLCTLSNFCWDQPSLVPRPPQFFKVTRRH